jgi:DNA-binding HxlR family transcriptional regulator
VSETTDPLAGALELVGDRWSLQLVAVLTEGSRRFNELQALLPGIAPNVLSARLRQLEAAGLLVGRPYSERPVRLSYELTEDGLALRDVVDALSAWERRRRGLDPAVHAVCGTPLRNGSICPTCGVLVDDDGVDEDLDDGSADDGLAGGQGSILV